MEASEKIKLLIPNGNSNTVLMWMRVHIAMLQSKKVPLPTETKLVEDTVAAFNRRSWISNPKHWIWNAAHIALDDAREEDNEPRNK